MRTGSFIAKWRGVPLQGVPDVDDRGEFEDYLGEAIEHPSPRSGIVVLGDGLVTLSVLDRESGERKISSGERREALWSKTEGVRSRPMPVSEAR